MLKKSFVQVESPENAKEILPRQKERSCLRATDANTSGTFYNLICYCVIKHLRVAAALGVVFLFFLELQKYIKINALEESGSRDSSRTVLS